MTFYFWGIVFSGSWIGLRLSSRLELEFPADSLADEDRQLLRYLAFPDFGPSRSAVESAVFPLRFRRGSGASRGVSRTGRSPCGPGPKREDGFYYAASSFQQLLGGFKMIHFCLYNFLIYCLICVPSQKKVSSSDSFFLDFSRIRRNYRPGNLMRPANENAVNAAWWWCRSTVSCPYGQH